METEIKLKVAAPDEARALLARLGAVPKKPRHLEDNVIWEDASASLLRRGKLLRLRRTALGATLTYKGTIQLGKSGLLTVTGVLQGQQYLITVISSDSAASLVVMAG